MILRMKMSTTIGGLGGGIIDIFLTSAQCCQFPANMELCIVSDLTFAALPRVLIENVSVKPM
jgi:hypothetical protein